MKWLKLLFGGDETARNGRHVTREEKFWPAVDSITAAMTVRDRPDLYLVKGDAGGYALTEQLCNEQGKPSLYVPIPRVDGLISPEVADAWAVELIRELDRLDREQDLDA